MKISKKQKPFIFGLLIGTVLLFVYIFSLPDGKLHIVFCNVGQGDAVYIRTPANEDLLIDGGPNDKVLSCLGKHMPFYDRTIDVIVLSHPQKDHLQGLISVVERYNVKYFVIGAVGNESEGYNRLVENIKKKNVSVKNLYKGDGFSLGKVKFSILWPEKEWVVQNLSPSSSDLSYLGDLSSSKVLGLSTTRDLNDFSYFVHLKYGTFDALFPGDGDSRVQPEVMSIVSLPDVEVLKYPHHGSKYGVTDDFLDTINPEFAVISVGKNPWSHPTKETLDTLLDRSIQFKRTDLDGDVEVISDGTGWRITP